ncbi:MAG: NAD+ synthase [Acidobacteriaceae bacterium]
MRIALAQINPTIGDFSGNTLKIRDFYERAAGQRAELVVFPELATCGYMPGDLLEKESFLERSESVLREVATLTAGEDRPAMLIGSPMKSGMPAGKRARNVAALIEGGEVKFVQQKALLPFYDVFDEQRYFEPATSQTLALVKGQPVAISVCEDAWNDKLFWPRRVYPVDPIEELMKQWEALPPHLGGERIILNISASPYCRGKLEVRRKMLTALARRHRAVVVLCNQTGANDSLIFDGSSFAVNAAGEVIAQAKSFAEDLVVFDTGGAAVELHDHSGTTEVWDALVLGTCDYVRKCGFHKALIGLSGGIDSALVAAIAVEALGVENVLGVGMPSGFSSEGSVSDAESLARNLGIEFTLLPVGEIYARFIQTLAPGAAETPVGLAEENLQPRIRGTLLMALSNKTGALVLTTGNKSEMAVGYCTLYGDMVGALAVIGDVFKTEVYALSRYANREREMIPESTLTKPPSAELRPGQRDTDSLPPYEVLDPILRAYVEDYASAEEIAAAHGVDATLVRSIIKLVERSEYKRQQAAPVLKVSKKSFGTGRRFPIAVKSEV